MKHKPSPATIIASVALFFSLGGVGLAAQHYLITSVHQIKPSVRHALRGERGPRGRAGAQGTAALATDDIDLVTEFYYRDGDVVTVPAGGQATATAPCDAHSDVSGGGFSASPGLNVSTSQRVFVPFAKNGPEAFNEWSVTATNPTSAPLTLQAHAVCTFNAR